jgi:hypothetical protein
MNLNANLNPWQQVGVICLGAWLLVSGWVTAFISFLILTSPPPNSVPYYEVNFARISLLNDIAPGYILFGVGPVIGFALLMKILGHPLGRTQLIGLGICAIIPFVLVLLYPFWK